MGTNRRKQSPIWQKTKTVASHFLKGFFQATLVISVIFALSQLCLISLQVRQQNRLLAAFINAIAENQRDQGQDLSKKQEPHVLVKPESAQRLDI